MPLPENAQPQTDDYREKSHPNAKNLLTDDFFWALGDELGPVGSDLAVDVFKDYWDWRPENEGAPASEYLVDWLEMFELDPKVTRAPIDLKNERTAAVCNKFDDIFIATAFAQFMCEGFLDEDIKNGVLKCLRRQTTRDVVEYRCDPKIAKERLRKLQKMTEAVTLMDTKPAKN